MKKKLLLGSLVLLCVILVTALGTASARKLGDENSPDYFSVSEEYNLKINAKKTESEHMEIPAGSDHEVKNVNGGDGDFMQGLIMSPVVIMEAIGENPIIISR